MLILPQESEIDTDYRNIFVMVLEQIELGFDDMITMLWYFSEVFSAIELTKQRLAFRMNVCERDENLFCKRIIYYFPL